MTFALRDARPGRRRHATPRRVVVALASMFALASCGATGSATPAADQPEGGDTSVTVTNCGKKVSFPTPAKRLYVNDGNMISMVLAIGAAKNVAGISSLGDDKRALGTAYGKQTVDSLHVATDTYPTRENIIATRPDVVVAGWNYGYKEEDNLTPDSLADQGIAAYVLTESCRQADGDSRGTLPPWEALRTDLGNLGKITGHDTEATEKIRDLDERLAALEQAPKANKPPTVFLFDSGTTQPFSSGAFGGPQGIIEAAGARNAVGDVKNTWTTVSWERVARARPDAIAFVDYPGQTFDQKVKVLRSNPATRDLEAVRQGRFLNLPYAAWTSGPLNIDAAEQLRASLEDWDLVPHSDIEPHLDLRP
ncbi:ABC transporter substrate-binding protein [Actinopolymorpha pittospori]|uniref:Iron complex transport system substrate-binding protein n=1 Tax=Actinopolymorpha pittospori TaxID=648752 RepID=A0A927N5T5_9ACTN|nr:ABC transporter substrate-binding protein [Actinopolymorpha pittospori]MBE1609040.1 iron complex transport system substrate-binding protein [Actinopolymorpha pittospori]